MKKRLLSPTTLLSLVFFLFSPMLHASFGGEASLPHFSKSEQIHKAKFENKLIKYEERIVKRTEKRIAKGKSPYGRSLGWWAKWCLLLALLMFILILVTIVLGPPAWVGSIRFAIVILSAYAGFFLTILGVVLVILNAFL